LNKTNRLLRCQLATGNCVGPAFTSSITGRSGIGRLRMKDSGAVSPFDRSNFSGQLELPAVNNRSALSHDRTRI
jgi:hypothetical protein